MTDILTTLAQIAPSWPWKTASAATVWAVAEKIAEKDSCMKVADVIREAFLQSKVPSKEMTSEDMALLPTAVRWKLMTLKATKKEPEKKPSQSVTQRMADLKRSL